MRVFSKFVCGFKRDGSVLLQKGENTLEEPLTSGERAFIDVMKLSGVVTEMKSIPSAPISETKLVSAKKATKKKKPAKGTIQIPNPDAPKESEPMYADDARGTPTRVGAMKMRTRRAAK